MSKEIALVFGYKDAPAELQKAADEYNTTYKKILKAETNMKTARAELDFNKKTLEKQKETLDAMLATWDPQAKAVK